MERFVIQYEVVNARNLRSLEAVVTLKLRDGWELVGGVFGQAVESRGEVVWKISSDGRSIEPTGTEIVSSTNWCQAMVFRGS